MSSLNRSNMRNSPYSSGLGATTTRGLLPGTAGRFRAKSRTVSIDSWLPVTPDKSKIAAYGPPAAATWPREAYSSRVAGSVTVPVTVTRRTWCVGSRSITYSINGSSWVVDYLGSQRDAKCLRSNSTGSGAAVRDGAAREDWTGRITPYGQEIHRSPRGWAPRVASRVIDRLGELRPNAEQKLVHTKSGRLQQYGVQR